MLSSDIIRKVRQIQIRTARQVSDVMAGEYHSVFKGSGIEFDEVRPYVPGDDVRTIDWNVSARIGEPYVKRFVEERELTVILLVDMSASLDFGSGQRSKREAASELSALLALSAIVNKDKIGLVLFDKEVEAFIPPRKGQRHALRITREVLAHDEGLRAERAADLRWFSVRRRLRQAWQRLKARRRSGGGERATNIAAALDFCQKLLKRRSVIFLISDFLDDGYLESLKRANQRHDVISVLVNDGREFAPTDVGLLTIEDAETGELVEVDTSSGRWREEAAAVARGRVDALRSRLMGCGVDFVEIDALGSVVDPLLAFFSRRQKRRG